MGTKVFLSQRHLQIISRQVPNADVLRRLGVPHTSFQLPPEQVQNSSPRESIELRAIVYLE